MKPMMNRFADGVLIFAVTFVVAVLVTLGWNAAFEDRAVVNWGTATILAVICAIVLPVAHALRERRATQS